MTMLPQPPPSAPAPPPSEAALRSQKVWKQVRYFGCFCVITVAIIVLSDPFHRPRGPHDQGKAFNNAQQIGIALSEFETEFGNFHDATTIAASRKASGSSSVPLGTITSNDFFRQFFTSKVALSEFMFYATALLAIPSTSPAMFWLMA